MKEWSVAIPTSKEFTVEGNMDSTMCLLMGKIPAFQNPALRLSGPFAFSFNMSFFRSYGNTSFGTVGNLECNYVPLLIGN
jgi:hypothetical protein